MRFHEHLIASFIPDFVEIQRESFYTLLKKGFIKELANRNPITNTTHDLELFFYPQYYQLNRPECTPTTAILKAKSYACKLYVPAQLTNRQTNEIKLQWVLLGNLPLMTKRGHFIINGSPRVVINQLVRSPGIYYQELIDIKKKKTFYADLIPLRGAWLRFEIDKKDRVWARMKKIPKISGLVFLQALGFTHKEIQTGIRFSDFLKKSSLKENHPDTTEQALVSLYEKSHQISNKTKGFVKSLSKTQSDLSFKENSQTTPIMGKNFLFRKFMNPRTYNLGLLGRMRLNKKFGLLIRENQLTLTRHDIFCAIDYLISLKYGVNAVDDIDNLKNRRVKASGELIQNQLTTGLIRLEKSIREKMKKVKKGLTIHSLITTKPINGALREFFGSSPLSQYMDQTNPLAEITHKRRLSCLGPGGITRETAGMAVRGIHPTHYGRICPIETPEGRNAGLVNSITIHARINSHGFIKTPFYNVYQGQVQKQDSLLRDARPIFFSAEQEEYVKIAPGDLKASKLNFLPVSKIPIRIGKEYHRVSREDVEYIAMSPIQMISIATSLIPFLEHDDATRALMGSNMQRQAVPIILPERPIVGTGLEARVAADSGHIVQARLGGYVSYASRKKIVLLEKTTSSSNFTNTFLGSNFAKRSKKGFFSNKLKSSNTNAFHFEHLFVNNLYKKSLPLLLTKTPFLLKAKYGRFNTVFRYKNLQTIFQKIKGTLFFEKNYKARWRTSLPSLQKDNFYSLQNTGILKSLPSNTAFNSIISPSNITLSDVKKSYKFFNLKNPSLINLLFLSSLDFLIKKLNQPLNFSHNYKSFAAKPDTTFSGVKRRSFISYLPLKKSIIHSLRSRHKTNKTTFFTNLHKLVRIQIYTNKLCLLITFDTSFVSQTLLHEENVDNFVRRERADKLLFRTTKAFNNKKVIKTKTQIKKEKINKLCSHFDRFTNKIFFDDIIGVENNKTRLRWGHIPDQSIDFVKDNKKFLKQKFAKIKPKQELDKNGVFVISSYTSNITKGYVKARAIEYPLQSYQRSNQDTCLAQRPAVLEGEWVQKADLLADCTASVSGDLSLGKNIFVAYMPWEGYNFEDAILISERLVYDDIYTSLHIERYELEIRDTQFGLEQISNQLPGINLSEMLHLDEKGIVIIGSWVKEGSILIGKVTPIKKKVLSPHEKLLYDIVGKKIPTTRETSLRVPKGVEGKVINVEILETENIPPGITFDGPGRVHIYLAEKRKIQVGDKISGRHGNKGIVSKIIPRQDMPYLSNGTPIDMVLNPLGVPSRMNVGQVFEALLGLAGFYLNQSFKIPSFDETYGPEASRSVVYSKLYEARLKSGQKWLFDPNFPGKTRLFDGRTGQCFDQSVTVGQAYMLKLVHLVDDKIHARSTGPYSLVTQQPLGGRSKHGGQRLGEMEVWALEGFGAAYTLQELLTIKSDDIQGRHQVINAILTDAPITLGTPESFKVLVRELQSLCLDLDIYTIGSMGRATPIDVMKLP